MIFNISRQAHKKNNSALLFLSLVGFFSIAASFLTNVAIAIDDLDVYDSYTLPLPPNMYQQVIDNLTLEQEVKKQFIEGGLKKGSAPQVFLQLETVNEGDNAREIKLDIACLASEFLKENEEEKPRKRRRLGSQSSSLLTVGKIILLENVAPPTDQGSIHLELLCVFDEFQGRGIGGKALEELKKLATGLAKKSPYYQTMTLLSQDVTHEGTKLAVVPGRVKFYMDHGFTFDLKTENLIQFLSIKHFIRNLDEEQLAQYMIEYILPEKTGAFAEKVAKYILAELKISKKFPDIPLEQLIQLVRTDGSCCSDHILDRAFYWGNGVTDQEQETFDKYVYLMRYHLNSPKVLPPLEKESSEKMSTEAIKAALTQTVKWKEKPLLPDQNELNSEICHLMFSPQTYGKSKDSQTVQKIKLYLNHHIKEFVEGK